MAKKNFAKKLWLVINIYLMFTLFSSNAFARDRRGGWSRSLPSRHEVVVFRNERYHYNEGRFYRPGWFGFGFFIVSPPIGAIVTTLPFGYKTIVVAGAPYYYYNDVYYRRHSSGYIIVIQPIANPGAVSVPPASQAVNPYYLTLTKIAEMASQDVPDSVIISEIERTHSVYQLTSETITYLKQHKVSNRVIDYMMGLASK